MSNELQNRYDFLLVFDVQDGNPNGDPDAGNLPRVDAETGKGLVTDVCLKRKVRNYFQIMLGGRERFDIFVKSKELSGIETFLNGEIQKGYDELGIDLETEQDRDGKKRTNKGKAQGGEISQCRTHLCNKFFDIRAFGAVLSTGANAGQVRGPVQLTFARSLDPVVASEHAISVSAARDVNQPFDSQVGLQGRKYTVPYGLYVARGFISPALARQTGFDEDDLNLLWQALTDMFEHDRSAARGMMSARKLIVFKHASALGNDHASRLFERVKIRRKDNVSVPRAFEDYSVTIDRDGLSGVELIEKL